MEGAREGKVRTKQLTGRDRVKNNKALYSEIPTIILFSSQMYLSKTSKCYAYSMHISGQIFLVFVIEQVLYIL
jgi:hypothetical protein